MIKFVIQNNIYAEEGFDSLINALERLDIPYVTVKVIPFIGELEAVNGELPNPGDEAIVMGSYTLAKAAVRNGWKPGAFLDNLDFEIQFSHWGKRMLNHDAKIYAFEDVPFQEQPFFIRPVHDTKAFTGLVTDWGEHCKWVEGLKRIPETADPVYDPLGINLLTVRTPVMVCSKKEVWSETRTWFVNGRFVTCSGYKRGTMKYYTPPEEVGLDIRGFAMDCVDEFKPNDGFVLDVADTPNGQKIVEINNLNSAGFYKGDMNKLVQSLVDKDYNIVRI